ncbi:recombination protein RecR [Candidatus Gottesmanbacteria bacterium RIFCSPHIGHO2_01_FULL_39_10]|uniref:Recombination protein RecR n=1 Tax=Candidatus Gottesmanbacteria bacterium RIFCSPHIGHO2_01_FULL_39_10 TaxID=1798375 RepID=A0A1F5ZQ21_9BACT|nr:MAG: recombination protein RecR [Candidatus Gottesmanbacteria bacterium RIFCSPHIGHO2_01_FULL_39_10]
MRILPKSIEKLIESFQRLPGIGPKTAQRLTFYLLHVPQEYLDSFSEAVKNLRTSTVYCSKCFNVGESDPCVICASLERDENTICVVESPIDILSLERTGKYKGVYHVLHGVISPLNNIGPDEIRIAELIQRIKKNNISEVILATNSNMEGEATAMYIARELKVPASPAGRQNAKCKVTRLAQGMPVGGDLEYADDMTLGHALSGRREYK